MKQLDKYVRLLFAFAFAIAFALALAQRQRYSFRMESKKKMEENRRNCHHSFCFDRFCLETSWTVTWKFQHKKEVDTMLSSVYGRVVRLHSYILLPWPYCNLAGFSSHYLCYRQCGACRILFSKKNKIHRNEWLTRKWLKFKRKCRLWIFVLSMQRCKSNEHQAKRYEFFEN